MEALSKDPGLVCQGSVLSKSNMLASLTQQHHIKVNLLITDLALPSFALGHPPLRTCKEVDHLLLAVSQAATWGQHHRGHWALPSMPHPQLGKGRFLDLDGSCTFAVIILCELIASPTAAVPLAAERAHCIDAGFSQAAVMAACDAFVDI